MGRVTIVVDVIDNKAETKMKMEPSSIQELSTAMTYLEIMKDTIKARIIKMSKWDVEEK